MISEQEQLDRGRLFRLKMHHNCHARQQALATIRQRPDGQWQARIGGRLRGRTVVHRLRRVVEADVNAHYTERMMRLVEGRPS